MSDPSVLVVGGGLSGLTTAVYLTRHGLTDVTVLEAAPVAGGQVKSWEDEDGDVVETGIHLAFPWYRNLPRLYEDISRPLNLVETDGNYYIMDGRSGEVSAARGGLGLFESLHGMLTFPGLSMGDRCQLAGLVTRVLGMSEEEIDARDGMSVADWLEAQGASEALERQLSVASVTIQGLQPERASAASFLRFFRHLYGTEGRFETAFFEKPLQEVLVRPLVEAIEGAGGLVRTRAPVGRIETEGGRATGVRLEHGTRLDADVVVLAVPGHQVPGLLEPHLRGRPPFAELQGMTSAQVTCLQMWYDQRVFGDGNVRISNRRGVIFDGVCDKAHHWAGWSDGSVLQVLIDDARDLAEMPDERLYRRVIEDLDRFFPACRGARPRKWTVLRHDSIYCETRPGYWARVPDGHDTPIEGLYLAGDYTDGPYHYGMDSAVIAGKRLARRVLARTGASELPEPPLPVEVPPLVGMMRRGG